MVSSPWTLTLKLLLPTFWFSFFGGLTIAMFFKSLDGIGGPFTPNSARLLMVSFLFLSGYGYYLFFSAIKWVAMDKDRFYVSNFLKSFQYTYDSIAKVEEQKVLFWHVVTVHFHAPGQFGQSIFFIRSYFWHYYLKKHPEVLKQILNKDISQH